MSLIRVKYIRLRDIFNYITHFTQVSNVTNLDPINNGAEWSAGNVAIS